MHTTKKKKKRKTEENKCEGNDFILISLVYVSASFYAQVERLKRKDRRMSEQEQSRVENVNGEMLKGRRSGKERRRDRLSCQAAVNLRGRDVEAADFFCTSPLICTSDYLNWLEQS